MSGHDFEKQVQQKMDQFQLNPQDAVWTAIEKEIRTKKKRRRIIFWLPLLALLLGGGLYYFLHQQHTSETYSHTTITTLPAEKNKTEKDVSPVSGGFSKTVTPVPSAKEGPALTDAAPAISEKQNNRKEPTAQKTTAIPARKNVVRKQQNRSRTYQQPNDVTVPAALAKQEFVRKQQSQNNDATVTVEPAAITDNPTAVAAAQKPVAEKADTIASDRHHPPVAITGALQQPKTIQATDSTAQAAKEKPQTVKRTKKSKWQWGISNTTGISRVTSGWLFNVFSEQKSADFSGGISTGGSPLPPTVAYTPAVLRTGLAINLGGFAERKLSKKTNLTIGMEYAFYSAAIAVGAKVDSALVTRGTGNSNVVVASDYYSNGSNKKYTNAFHLLQVPVNFYTRLNKNANKPFLWNYGITPAWLVSNNYLHFESSSGAYYKDPSLNNQLQLFMQTGFSFTAVNAKKWRLTTGPVISYSLSGLFNDNNSRKHLFTTGLNTRVLFKK